MGLQSLYPFIEASNAKYALCLYLSMASTIAVLRHAGRLIHLNQRRRCPWTQQRPDEHLDSLQDEGILNGYHTSKEASYIYLLLVQMHSI
jgi:hypothetical protein